MPRRVVKKLNSIGRIGRSGAMDRFDPNAIDGDDDGLVQEQTRFERPASPRISGSVSGRQMTPEMVERDKEIIRRRNEGQQTQRIADDMGITLQTVNYALHRGRKRGEVTYADNTNEPKPDRDAEIIKRFIAGESQPSIARDLGMPAATVGNVISRARKRGESIPFRERTKKKPDIAPKEAEPTFYESVAKLNDEGKSVAEIAQELNVKARDVIQALVQNRQTSEIEKRRRGIRGAVGPGRKESMQKYVDKPSLDIDAETIAESIGFWGGWNLTEDLKSRPYYNYTNHPQFSYDLQTGKPVRILGSRADSPDIIDKIVKEGKYVIPPYEGSYGRGGNFAFDGDPLMGEVYSESIGEAEYPGSLERTNRLITRIDLRNPIVVNVGVADIDENTRINEMNWNGPREKRIATRQEAKDEYIKQLGGEKKVRALYKRLLDIERNKPEESKDYGFSVEEISNADESREDRLNRYQKIVDGGEILKITPKEFNRLARIAGHDGIVRLAIGHYESDTSHIIVLDERRIKVIGKRPAYSKETIKNRELQLVEKMRMLINGPRPIHPGFHMAEFINRAIGQIEEMLEDKETNPDSWTELDDKSIIRQANIILMYYGEAQAKIKFAKENGIETTDKIKNTLEEGLQIALATKGLKRRKGNKLSGSIRRPEPEVWEMPQEDLIPFDVGDYDNELEGGALYDEMIGPKPRVSRPNDRNPLTAESATQRRTALIAGGFVNLDDEIQVRDGKFVSQEAREAIARDFADDKLSMAEIAKKYKVSPSWIRKKFPEVSSAMSRNRRRNDSIRQDFLNGASVRFLSNKYDISQTHIRSNILSDLLKERGDGEDAQETYRDNTRRRINRRTRKNSNKISKNKPSTPGSVGPNKDTEANVPTEPLVTPGGISGSMSNENFNVGLKLKTKTKISPLEDGLFQVDIDYGDLTINAEVDLDNYSSYKDAYDRWIDWDGNYGMRVASAALMGENLPEAWGYRGSDDGTHHHDVISTGVMASGARESLPTVEKQVTDALITLHHINTGKETNIRPIYRGVSNVTAGNELLSLGNGSVITMPLSAFTADRKVANMYATGMGKTNDGLILEVLPGARVGDAAGDQYLHRFDLIDDKGNVEGSAVDVTESITQGKFKFVGMSTILVPNQSGGNDSVKKITLEQIETFNPIKGSYEKNSGKLAGSMSSKRDQFLARVGEVRPITQGLVPGDVQSLQARAVEMYVQRSPILIKRLSDIEKNNSWQYATDAINPDGSRMSKEQYIAFKTNEIRQMGQQYASNRLNKQDPDTRPRHIEQLQHNVDLMFAASPELQMLCEQYGYPLYAIFNAQEVRDKDGKNVWKPNTEAHENNMAGLANGVTLWGLGISAIYPYSDDAFIPEGMPLGQAIQDPRRLLNGHWGIRPESYGTGVDTDPMSLHRLLIEQHMNQYEKLGRRPDITDVNTPLGTLRHETSHNIHSGAVARALLDVLENPSIENREKYALLTLLFKPNWQSAFAASAGNSKQVQMMYDQAVSDYAASSPPEWFAETLSAALSPSEKTRSLLNFNHRGILAIALPELREYLIEGDWP
jgi:DNA-binding NarL/FixJ family response regulator/Mor family transcriptional regulator